MSGQGEFEFDPRKKVRASDPRTAHKAAMSNLPLKGTQRRKILEAHCQHYLKHQRGLIDDRLPGLTGIALNSANTRRSELVDGNWLEDSGEEEVTASGANAISWQPTVKALAWAEFGNGELK
jgi:hypothetical protein